MAAPNTCSIPASLCPVYAALNTCEKPLLYPNLKSDPKVFRKKKDLSKPLEPVLWAGPCPIMNWQSYGPWYLSLTYNNSIMMHGWLGVRGEGGLSGGPVQEDSDALQGALSLVFCAVSAHTLQAAGPPVFEGQI